MNKNKLLNISIKRADEDIYRLSKEKWDAVAKPIDGLGRFEDMVCKVASMRGTVSPGYKKKALIIMCADNGVVKEGVSQTGQEVTRDVAGLMGKRRSSVGIMTKDYPLDIFVYDVGINAKDTPEGVKDVKVRRGTADFLEEPAMTEEEALKAVSIGIDAVKECTEKGYDIIATGEMGIGNTTTSTALLCSILRLPPEDYVGKGSGLTEEGLSQKLRVIEKGLETYPDEDAFQSLRNLGGLDIAALCGVFIGGAVYGIPVVIDGLISAVAALVAEKLVPGCKDFMLASHMGREKGMDAVMNELSLKPLICADLALGEGTGAVLLFPILDMVFSLYESGTTFKNADIEKYERYEK